MTNADPASGQTEAVRLLSKVNQNYQLCKGGNRCLFSFKIEETNGSSIITRLYVMDNLHFNGSILFGSIGVVTMTMDELIRERDTITFSTSELTTSAPTAGYEYYTYFAIKASRRQLLILRNGNMPEHISSIIASICFQAIEGEPYNFEVEAYQEKTIREQIKELNKSKISARIQLSQIELEGKSSFRRLKSKADKKGVVSITMTLHYDEKLDDETIDDLLDVKDDIDIKRLVIKDTEGSPKDADEINLLKEVVKAKRDIKIQGKDIKNVELVWNKFIEALDTPTT